MGQRGLLGILGLSFFFFLVTGCNTFEPPPLQVGETGGEVTSTEEPASQPEDNPSEAESEAVLTGEGEFPGVGFTNSRGSLHQAYLGVTSISGLRATGEKYRMVSPESGVGGLVMNLNVLQEGGTP